MEADFQISLVLNVFVSQLVGNTRFHGVDVRILFVGADQPFSYVLGAVLKWLAFEKSPTHFQNKNENIIA